MRILKSLRNLTRTIPQQASETASKTASPATEEAPDLPAVFDADFYRKASSDLKYLDNAALLDHYITHGIAEGRRASAMSQRRTFRHAVGRSGTVLEIGPFANPFVIGPNVSYFDVLDKVGLRKRAEAIGARYDPKKVPEIDFVSPTGDLSVVRKVFDAVVSVHCIEHQPDLIKHLHDVAHLLVPGGRYFAIIPDHRYCFDHFIPASTVAEILEAHVTKRKIHTVGSVIEHRALVTHNDASRHWAGDHIDFGHFEKIPARIKAALHEHANANGSYIDVHAWQFTPGSFRETLTHLVQSGFCELAPVRVYETPRNELEFMSILQKPNA